MAKIAERLRQERQKRGWSQRRLARETGLSQTTISNIEGVGSASVRTDTIELIAGKLGLKPSSLCWGEDG